MVLKNLAESVLAIATEARTSGKWEASEKAFVELWHASSEARDWDEFRLAVSTISMVQDAMKKHPKYNGSVEDLLHYCTK
jgi:hypothetical protein